MKELVSEFEKYVIITVVGAIKSGLEFDHADTIAEIVNNDRKRRNIIINLEKVPFINSACLGIWLNNYRLLEKINKEIVLFKPSADVKNLLEITKLNSIMPTFTEIEKAIGYADK